MHSYALYAPIHYIHRMHCIHQVDIEPVSSCSQVVLGRDGDGLLLEGGFSQYAGKNMPLTGRVPYATVLGYARSSLLPLILLYPS